MHESVQHDGIWIDSNINMALTWIGLTILGEPPFWRGDRCLMGCMKEKANGSGVVSDGVLRMMYISIIRFLKILMS